VARNSYDVGSRVLGDAIYYGVGGFFYLVPRLLYRLHVEGAGRYRHRPSTLIVVNHKRDLDSVILPPTLYFNGVRPRRPLWFAGREDMFVRGYLATYEVVPAWLRRLLYEIDLTAVLRTLRILPIRRFRERTMAEALREVVQVYGDRPAAEVLDPSEATVLMRRHGSDTRLSASLSWEFRQNWRRPARLRAFTPAWRPRLRLLQREVVARQLRALADLLTRGGILYMAPEGVISPDGRFQVFRSGLRGILAQVEAPLRVQPIAIVYDFMRPGALRVLITIGEEVPARRAPGETEDILRRTLAGLQTMTCSQVASQVVWDLARAGRRSIGTSQFVAEVQAAAAALAEDGLRLDGALLDHRGPDRVAGWLRYAERCGAVRGRRGEIRVVPEQFLYRPATHWDNPIRYCANEVQSVRQALRAPSAVRSPEDAIPAAEEAADA